MWPSAGKRPPTDQLQQVARLNAMGEMAGALAHELSQPLAAATNYIAAARELVARGDAPATRIADLLDKAGAQTLRAGEVVARVRAGLDDDNVAPTQESLSAIIHEAVDLAVAGSGGRPPVIRVDLDRHCDPILVDRVPVQQVVLNLVRNAIEAMDSVVWRELVIASRPGGPGFVEVRVSDSGPGIAPEVAAQLFQPFASGKPDGMGVGLALSRSIVEAHGGRMWARAAAGGGAAFHFTLPRAPG